MMTSYMQGWNDFLDGRGFSWINTSSSWQEGWIACRDASKKGAQPERF
ncbi:MAG: hypothetical protein [Bacteriophage sp.]|nr:MAG: hypothetical protein [Bacteriophage sp.]